MFVKESLNKLIPLMVRQAHHERNQQFTVRPEPVEGLNLSFLRLRPLCLAVRALLAGIPQQREDEG